MNPPETAKTDPDRLAAGDGVSPIEETRALRTAARLEEIAELAPDTVVPPLPDRRRLEDLPVGHTVLAFIPADRDGTRRELIPGQVDSTNPAGWIRVALDWAPGGYIVDVDSDTVIPLEALPHLDGSRKYLEAWTAGAAGDSSRHADELYEAIQPWLETEEIRVAAPARSFTGSIRRREKVEVTAEEIIERLGLGHLIGAPSEPPSPGPKPSSKPHAVPRPVEPERPVASRPDAPVYVPPADEVRRDTASLEEELLSEGCSVAWEGLHRNLSDGSNPYME